MSNVAERIDDKKDYFCFASLYIVPHSVFKIYLDDSTFIKCYGVEKSIGI